MPKDFTVIVSETYNRVFVVDASDEITNMDEAYGLVHKYYDGKINNDYTIADKFSEISIEFKHPDIPPQDYWDSYEA